MLSLTDHVFSLVAVSGTLFWLPLRYCPPSQLFVARELPLACWDLSSFHYIRGEMGSTSTGLTFYSTVTGSGKALLSSCSKSSKARCLKGKGKLLWLQVSKADCFCLQCHSFVLPLLPWKEGLPTRCVLTGVSDLLHPGGLVRNLLWSQAVKPDTHQEWAPCENPHS